MALIWLLIKLIVLGIKLFIISIFAFLMMAGLDYIQINNGDLPVFVISRTVSDTRIETFRGFFHTVTRKIYASPSEPLTDSQEVNYSIFTMKFPIEYEEQIEHQSLRVETAEIEECKEKAILLFANADIKVYTYCLNSIDVFQDDKKSELAQLLEKDTSILDDIDSKMNYMGMYKNNIALEFTTTDEDFANQGLKMYRCHKEDNNDVYIGSKNMTFQTDFCTNKKDDLKYISKITDTTPEEEKEKTTEKEEKPIFQTFYEDTENYYQLELSKSKYLVIETENIRDWKGMKIPIKEALDKKFISIEELKEIGLDYKIVSKNNNQTNES